MAAVNQDYTYNPQLKTIRTYYPDGSVTVTQSVVAAKRRIFRKPANTNNPPQADGFRNPSSHWMDYFDWHQYGVNTVIRSRHSSGSIIEWSGAGHFAVQPPSGSVWSPPSSLKAGTEVDALLKLKDAKVNLGVSFGERKEAAEMMYNNLGKVAKAYKNFRRGNFRQAARNLGLGWRDAPDRWLEYQYGWKPLLGDIHSAVEEIHKKDGFHPPRTWFYVKAKRSTVQENVFYRNEFSGTRSRYHDRARVDCHVRFDFKPNPAMGLEQTLDQWGVLNPLEVGWELIPFSFVVDWAIPVGDYLSALSAPVPYTFRAGSCTTWLEGSREVRLENLSLLTAIGEAKAAGRRMNRVKYTSFPLPSLSALASSKTPQAQTIATRCANAISLIASAFK